MSFFHSFRAQDLGVIGLVIVTFVALQSRLKRRTDDLYKLPIPTLAESHWLWGHELTVWKAESSEKYFEWTRLFGSVFRIKTAFFQKDVIIVSDTAAAAHIHQQTSRYGKAPAFLPLTTKLLGRGVVWAHGAEHKRQRRLITPAFTLNAVRGMEADVFECSEKLAARLRNQIIAQGYETTVNIEPLVASATLDIIGRVGFGHDFGSGESSEAKAINDAWHQDVVMGNTFAGFIAPLAIGAFPIINHLPIPALQKDGVAKTIAIELAGKILAANRENLSIEKAQGDSQGKDMLSILVRDSEARKGGKGDFGDEETLADWQLLENISTFIMVGHETTSCSVIFTLLELAKKPEIQAKLRQEISAAGDLNYEELNKLPYLDAVTKEGLRIHPAGPRTDRVALEDDVIPLSKPQQLGNGKVLTEIRIKAGQVVRLPSAVQNCDPEVWGPDAREFSPERFLDSARLPAESAMPKGPYGGLATFLDGPRTCIGWRLAVMEFKVLLATLVRDVIFEDTGKKIREFEAGTLQAYCDGEAAHMPLKIKLAHA